MRPWPRQKITIGRPKHLALPSLGVERVQAKIDTGAFRSALHYVKVRTRTVDGNKQLVVTFGMARKRVTMVFKRFQRVSVKSSNGETSRRWLITTVSLNGLGVRT